ncbi:branched-chain amino acid ABC transporter substrate-binding protein [Bordetella avium]|uniref:Leu/ile/val-binding protein n=1 Tax=Bordetella avium (strain 197N) TaxID=360910 RepID=Q2L0H4_BORA1|nr:branched-chain amino acid ABC transporter substrate-binding protein [Bordetella avium]AZY49246.1 branched-chain amino acid ABC transporter substrate-binding protein [Bordetella avium]AZY52602.1 branched-chain amino acid ABC transporter substrate-binding protein [Bordetella avium]RIQ19237.1 branched-chain amino acid ABC transporter substrate-binding protein [Bordetella avium]RIQ33404.1 branched-chain amino acid ABC transporter substrate-binding protein [Bordetella avium]RIQ52805.1 branched-c
MNTPFRLTPILAACGLALGLAAGAQAENIKIGVVGPTTGPVTQYGDMVREGVNTAIEQINAAGGVNGQKLEAVVIDDGCEPKQGPVAANRVVNAKIGFVVGHVCSGATIAATEIYNNEGVVMITPSATSPAVTDGKGYEFIFRTIGRDDQQGPAAAKFILEKIKPQRVAVLHDKQSYGQGIATAVKNDLEKGGVKVPVFEGINAGDSDYSAVITKLKSNGIDFVYFGGYHPEMGLLLRQAAEQGVKTRFMGPEGVGNPDINAIAGDAVEGMLLTLPADFTQNPANASIVKAFQDKKRNPSGAFQLTAYAATQAIADGIKGAGSTDPTKVAKYLHANAIETPIGKTAWNKQGDLTDFEFQVYTWHKDGSKSVFK